MESNRDKNVHTEAIVSSDDEPVVVARAPTLERRAFVDGLREELDHQVMHYLGMVQEIAALQGKIELAGRNVPV